MKLLEPDQVAASVHQVDYKALARSGRRALLFDLENTLCLYRTWSLDERTWNLLRGLAAEGFRLGVVSNAAPPEESALVQALRQLGVVTVWKARKPLRSGFNRALALLEAKPAEAVMVGDQVLTDVWGGQRAGLYTVLVDPLRRRESRWTRVNRLVERLLGRRRAASPRP